LGSLSGALRVFAWTRPSSFLSRFKAATPAAIIGCGRTRPELDRWFASGKQGDPPGGFLRYTGGGNYAGILVSLWRSLQHFRPAKRFRVFIARPEMAVVLECRGDPFICCSLSAGSRRSIACLRSAVISSTIRNPAKFTSCFQLGNRGAFCLRRACARCRYLEARKHRRKSRPDGEILCSVCALRPLHDRCGIGLATAVLGWLILCLQPGRAVKYLQEVQFDQAMAEAMAKFSFGAGAVLCSFSPWPWASWC